MQQWEFLANGQVEGVDGKLLRGTCLNIRVQRKELDWLSRVGGFSIGWLAGFFAKNGLSRPREAWWTKEV